METIKTTIPLRIHALQAPPSGGRGVSGVSGAREYVTIAMLLALFLFFPWLSRHIDVTSAPLDPGILSVIIMAVLAFLIFKAVTWWVIRAIWPVFAGYSSLHFERNFNSLLSWQKVLIYLAFYLLLLFGMVGTLAALV